MFGLYETERFAGVKFPLALKKINSFHSQEQKQSDGGRGHRQVKPWFQPLVC